MSFKHIFTRGALCSLPGKTDCTFSVLKCLLRQHSKDTAAIQQVLLQNKTQGAGVAAVICNRHVPVVHSSSSSWHRTITSWRQMSGPKFQTDPLIRNFTQSLPSKEGSVLVEQHPQEGLYSRIVQAFPEGIQMAFAYGSGAFKQAKTKDMSQNMLDFIFVVDRPRKWHRLNLEKHPHHYSFLKRFGPHTIAQVQERYGAGIYFNTLVPMEGRIIKYGVISTARLINDLLDWESLYVSGRLHKPVSLIILPANEDLLTAMKVNLWSAFHAALLLLPDMFTEEQFYTSIANLSYAGDFRMAIAEDNNKIANIVRPNMDHFRRMYGPLLLEDEHVTWWQTDGQIEQALTFDSRHYRLKGLPGQVLYGLLMQKYQVGVFPDLEEIIKIHAHDSECDEHVARSIRNIVKKSSFSQSLKGILTAGFRKSIRYSLKKVLKKIRSWPTYIRT